jgi:hypothetical protein
MDVGKSLLKVLLLSFTVFLTACGGAGGSKDNSSEVGTEVVSEVGSGVGLADGNQEVIESNPIVTVTDPVEESIYTVSGLYAVYYSEDDHDPDRAGAGTDGSDPEIIRTKIAEEPVDTLRLNYVRDDFNEIDSKNLNIFWSGEINVESPTATTYLTIDSSWSSVNVNIDGQRYFSQSNCSPCIVTLKLDQGDHSFEIDIHNHWHTTEASALFADQSPKKAELITTRISTPAASPLVFIDIYESKTLNSSVVIDVPEGDEKITIFAHSYSGVRWQLEGATDRVDGFYYSSYGINSEAFGTDKSAYLGYSASSSSITDSVIRKIFSKPIRYKISTYGADTIQLVLDQTTSVDQYEDEITIFDNLQGAALTTRIAESSLDSQEIATKFSVTSPVLLKNISWSAWSEQRTENSDFFGSIRSKTYTVSVYSGDTIPSSLETFEVVRAQARFFYSTERGDVYSMEAEFEADHVLQPGTYWISMQHHDSSGPRYSVVLKTEGSLQGGVFRNDDTPDWVHIDGTLNSPGVSMSLSGLK